MPDYTPYQQRVIKRYYGRRGEMAVQTLGEIVTEMYLTSSEKSLERLWQRAESALRKMALPDDRIAHLLRSRKPELLAKLVDKAF